MIVVYRVQDKDGRGPVPMPPAIHEDFGASIIGLMDPRFHNGCALETLVHVDRWFSPTERRRLTMLGYRLVRISVDVVLAASESQLVVARKKPFNRDFEPVAWPVSDGREAPRRATPYDQ